MVPKKYAKLLFLLPIILVPTALSAETTLYACIRNGQTTLESVAEKDCDQLQTYQYPSYEKTKAKPGLRSEEVRELQALESTLQQQAQSHTSLRDPADDDRQEKCAYYRSQLNSALAYFGVDHLPITRDIELDPNILRFATILRPERSAIGFGTANTINVFRNKHQRGSFNITPFTSSLDNEYAIATGDMKSLVQQAQTEIKYYCY